MLIFSSFVYIQCQSDKNANTITAEDQLLSSSTSSDTTRQFPIHESTGLVMDPAFPLIIAHCTSCHSAKLITQNRATREGWAAMIDWMQATQGLWQFDEHEPQILDYLATYYGPVKTGRRKALVVEEWYELE